jgi:hypothetical protein
MRAIPDDVKKLVLADYSVGVKQQDLAVKYKISLGMINKIVKGTSRTNTQVVKQLTDISGYLSGQPIEAVDAIEREVLMRVRDMEYFRAGSLKIINRALEKVDHDDITMYELEKAQNIIGKGRENIYGKHPDTQVNVQNNNSGQNSEIRIRWED